MVRWGLWLSLLRQRVTQSIMLVIVKKKRKQMYERPYYIRIYMSGVCVFARMHTIVSGLFFSSSIFFLFSLHMKKQ